MLTGEEGLGGGVEHGERVGDHGSGCGRKEEDGSGENTAQGRGWAERGGVEPAGAVRPSCRSRRGSNVSAGTRRACVFRGPCACSTAVHIGQHLAQLPGTASWHGKQEAQMRGRPAAQAAALRRRTRAGEDEAAAQLLGAHAGEQQVRDLHRAHGVALQVGHLLVRGAAAGGRAQRHGAGLRLRRTETSEGAYHAVLLPRCRCSGIRCASAQGMWAVPGPGAGAAAATRRTSKQTVLEAPAGEAGVGPGTGLLVEGHLRGGARRLTHPRRSQ